MEVILGEKSHKTFLERVLEKIVFKVKNYKENYQIIDIVKIQIILINSFKLHH
jgi:hypothetical protein